MRHYDLLVVHDPHQQWTLERLAVRAGMHPGTVQRLVEAGLIQPTERQGSALYFDPSALPRVRVIRRLHEVLGVNLAGISVILDLLDRMNALQRENESLRKKL